MTIKALGNYTSQLKNLTTGIPIILDGPYGTFTPLADSRKKVFIAGGIGITPFHSILSSRCKNINDKPETVLLWSAQGVKDIIDASFYEQMSETCSWFTFIPMLTELVAVIKMGKPLAESDHLTYGDMKLIYM